MAKQQDDQHPHWGDLTDVIEREAEALRDLTDTVTQWVAGVVATPPRHLLDLGSGTGAGTFALLRRFPDARVTAVDSSPQMLGRLQRRGLELGLTGRLAVVRADLDDGLPRIDAVDLVWASSVVHHLKHPDSVLAQVAGLLPVSGWLVLVEAEDVPWFLPDDLGIGRPGLERRCHELLAQHRDAQLPDVGSDWSARLTAAGYTVQTPKVFEAEVPSPLPEAAIRYAQGLFGMLREVERERLDADDVAALDVLLDDTDPRGLARRQDLTLRAIRKTWAAQPSRQGKNGPQPGPATDYEAFRRQRLAMLTAPGGSLSMIAMPAITTSPRTFPGLPGTWSCPAGAVSVTASSQDHLQVDGQRLDGTAVLGPESVLRFSGTVTASVAREVDGTWFLQVADSNSPNLAAFAGLETYEINPGWVINATYRARAEADRVILAGRLGSDQQHQRDSPGDVTLTLGGQEHHLAVYASFMPNWVTVNFTDETSGAQTPPAGRILALPGVPDGPIMLDFNQAMLLPHESSPVYPCPVPPAGNHLPVAVTAGERAVRFNR